MAVSSSSRSSYGQQSPVKRVQRNLQLDVLRGVAILMVLLCHSVFLRQPTWDLFLWRPGWSGVDLFFVISGFLISGLLFTEYQKTGGIRFKRFAIRRALKLYPAFYSLVLITLITRNLTSQGHLPKQVWDQLLHDIFFLQSYWQGSLGHFWSLSVEEHFYILLPLMLWLLLRRNRGNDDPFRLLPWLFLTVACVVLAARLLNAQLVKPFGFQTHLFPTHLRIDSLFFGVLLSYFAHFHRERFTKLAQSHRKLIFCAAVVLLAPAFIVGQYEWWMYTYGFTFLYLGYGCLLIWFLHCDVESLWPPALACLRALGYIGTFSYSIYLWNVTWLWLVGFLGLPYAWLKLLLFYVGAVFIGIVTGKLIELPVLRLRERMFPATDRSLSHHSSDHPKTIAGASFSR